MLKIIKHLLVIFSSPATLCTFHTSMKMGSSLRPFRPVFGLLLVVVVAFSLIASSSAAAAHRLKRTPGPANAAGALSGSGGTIFSAIRSLTNCDYHHMAKRGYACWYNDWQKRDDRCRANGNYDADGGRYSFEDRKSVV